MIFQKIGSKYSKIFTKVFRQVLIVHFSLPGQDLYVQKYPDQKVSLQGGSNHLNEYQDMESLSGVCLTEKQAV